MYFRVALILLADANCKLGISNGGIHSPANANWWNAKPNNNAAIMKAHLFALQMTIEFLDSIQTENNVFEEKRECGIASYVKVLIPLKLIFSNFIFEIFLCWWGRFIIRWLMRITAMIKRNQAKSLRFSYHLNKTEKNVLLDKLLGDKK